MHPIRRLSRPLAQPRSGGLAGRLTPAVGLLLLVTGCDSSPSDPGLEPTLECSSANTLTLSVGDAERRVGRDTRTFCVGGPAGAEYVLVSTYLAPEPGASTPLVLEAEGTAPAAGPLPAPSSAASASAGGTLPHPFRFDDGEASPLERDAAFDHGLRMREERELRPRIRDGAPSDWTAAAGAGADLTGAPATVPMPGAIVELNAQATSACANAVLRGAEVMAVSSAAIVVADTARPANGFSTSDFQGFAAAFDTLVAPLVRRNFGRETDLDANGRVILFFTPEVNRLTEAGSERFVGGFFFSRDLFPRVSTPRLQACATSNEAEILYLMVPDPGGTINQNARSVDFVRRLALSTIGHEFQHLVNAARRIHVLNLPSNRVFEEVWLNEGLSHAAEELLFFQTSGLSPRSNLGLTQVQAGGPRAVNAINAYHVANLQRYRRFLEAPEIHSAYDSVDNLEARGAAQNFLRYAVDRVPQGEEAFFRALVDGPQVGWENLATRVGGGTMLRRWYADWTVAHFADDRVPGIQTAFRHLSWSHPSLFAGLNVSTYPLRTRLLTPQNPVSVQLRAGGAVYGRFTVPGPGVARITTSTGGGALPAELHLTLLRTR